MHSGKSETPCSNAAEISPGGKRRYEAPRVLFREPLETVAAVCSPGKAFGQVGGCTLVVSS